MEYIERKVFQGNRPRRKNFEKPSKTPRAWNIPKGHKWQRRLWAHLIEDQNDYNKHVDYIHWNPVKHGYVKIVSDWEYSSFHRFAEQGIYELNWGNDEKPEIKGIK